MDGGTDIWKFTPLFYRTLALWGRCSKREITWLRSNSEVTFYLYLLFLKLNIWSLPLRFIYEQMSLLHGIEVAFGHWCIRKAFVKKRMVSFWIFLSVFVSLYVSLCVWTSVSRFLCVSVCQCLCVHMFACPCVLVSVCLVLHSKIILQMASFWRCHSFAQ